MDIFYGNGFERKFQWRIMHEVNELQQQKCRLLLQWTGMRQITLLISFIRRSFLFLLSSVYSCEMNSSSLHRLFLLFSHYLPSYSSRCACEEREAEKEGVSKINFSSIRGMSWRLFGKKNEIYALFDLTHASWSSHLEYIYLYASELTRACVCVCLSVQEHNIII